MPVDEVLSGVDGLSLTCCLPQSSRNVHDRGAALASARDASGRPCVDYRAPQRKPSIPSPGARFSGFENVSPISTPSQEDREPPRASARQAITRSFPYMTSRKNYSALPPSTRRQKRKQLKESLPLARAFPSSVASCDTMDENVIWGGGSIGRH